MLAIVLPALSRLAARRPLGLLLGVFFTVLALLTAGSLPARAAGDHKATAWGTDNFGSNQIPTAAQSGVVAVAAGEYHGLALKSDGSVVAWGYNGQGEATVPAAAQSGVIAIAAGSEHSLALKSDGSVVAWGNDTLGETNVPAAAQSGVVAIAAGVHHSLALKSDGSVVAWGNNNMGQTTVPAAAQSGVVGVSAGEGHSLAVKSDGSVVAWGDNTGGQATVPAAAQSGVIAVAAGWGHSLALKNDGTVVAWGADYFHQREVPFGLTNVIAIAGGAAHSLALRSDGTVVGWGYDGQGQTDVPAGLKGVTSISAGNQFSLAASPVDALSAQGVAVSAKVGSAFTGPVATFTDANGLTAASAFTASITWGDGTAASAGTVSGSGGSFSVSGTHTYLVPGSSDTVTTTITGPGGPATATSTATVGTLSPQYVSPSGSDSNVGTILLPKRTIQAAINATQSGDTVIVEDGTYTGPGNVDLDFGGRNSLTVTSQHGAATTILNCAGSSSAPHRGFYLHSGETGAVISGLTIENGYEPDGNNFPMDEGAGILIGNATVTVIGCTFTGGQAGRGGGVDNFSGTVTLTGCTFTNNKATDRAGGGGGVESESTLTMTGCTLTGNTAANGGGLLNFRVATLTDDVLYGDSGNQDFYQIGTGTPSHCDIAGYAPAPDAGGNFGADPLLAALNNYGGPTPGMTFALLPGSPCLGAGVAVPGVSTDGRGVAVPQNGRYDVGAFESRGFTLASPGGSGQSTPVGQKFGTNLTVTVTANAPGEPVANGILAVTAPATTGASATLTPFTVGANGTANATTGPRANFSTLSIVGANGAATATADALAGSYTVTASTRADPAPASYALTNTKATPTLAVTSNNNPSTFGQSVTFTATLTKAVNPSGTVTFSVDGGAAVPADANSTHFTATGGTATFTTSALSGGTHTITARYGGDANNNATTSPGTTQTVNPAATSTGLTSDNNPSQFGQSVTFTATVTPSVTGQTPTGTVTFTVDGKSGSPVTLTNGSASSPPTTSLSVGTHTVTAKYNGDTNNAASDTTAAPLTQTVNKATSATALASSLNPSQFGQSVTFTATVMGQNPTGTVTFTLTDAGGKVTTDTEAVNAATGVAAYTTSTLAVGTYTVTAAYSGDGNNAGSDTTASPLTQTVNKATSATALASSLNPSQFGQPVTFAATVTGQNPTGTVTFTDTSTTPATALGTGTLSGGTASSPPASGLSVGSHTITAAYGGDGNNAGSTSGPLTQTVYKATSATGLTSSSPNDTSFVGQPVTFTASVTGQAPTGSVTFYDGGTALGQPVPLSGGTATLTTSALAVGSHAITARYSGDGNNAPSTFATLTQTVTNTTVTVSSASSVYGQSATFTASLHGVGAVALPGRTLTFSLDGTPLGTAVTDGTSVATLHVALGTTYAPGSHVLTVSFGGDAAGSTPYHAASSSTGTLFVSSAGSSLTVPGIAGTPGQTVTLSARLTRTPDRRPLVGQSLSFFVDGMPAGPAGLTDGNGQTSQDYAVPGGMALGGHKITAVYGGATGYGGCSGLGTLSLFSASGPTKKATP